MLAVCANVGLLCGADFFGLDSSGSDHRQVSSSSWLNTCKTS